MAGLGAAVQPSQVGASRVIDEPPDRAEHALLDVQIKSFEILLDTSFELDGPWLCAHESPCLRMISE